jgi:GTPase
MIVEGGGNSKNNDDVNTINSKENINSKTQNLIPEMSTLSLQNSVKEVRVAVIGNVDSGKSTLVGVLTKCSLDDGRGSLRKLVFNFTHEKDNGRTSSVTQEMMGFKKGKQIEPERLNEKKHASWINITKHADKIVSLIDLCGHEMYLKTTIFGLTGLLPDYALIVVGANMGVQRMTKEHLVIALALKIPIFIVMTKIDIAPDDIRKNTLENIIRILKSSGAQKMPIVIREDDDLNIYSQSILSNTVCPIFSISSTNGEGIPKLRTFMGTLMSRKDNIRQELKIDSNLTNNINKKDDGVNTPDKVEFLIDSVFSVKGVGLVCSGTLISGKVVVNQTLLLGPNTRGK